MSALFAAVCIRILTLAAFIIVVAFPKPPDLNQARVNKCLIALVNRKIVYKDNSTVSVRYMSFFAFALTYVGRELYYITGAAPLHEL